MPLVATRDTECPKCHGNQFATFDCRINHTPCSCFGADGVRRAGERQCWELLAEPYAVLMDAARRPSHLCLEMMVKSVVDWSSGRLGAKHCAWPARVGDEMPQAKLLRTAFGVNDGEEDREVVRWAPLRGATEAGLALAFDLGATRIELFGLVDYRWVDRPGKRFGLVIECAFWEQYANGARLMPWVEHEVVVWRELQATVSGPYSREAFEVVRTAHEWWAKTLQGKTVTGLRGRRRTYPTKSSLVDAVGPVVRELHDSGRYPSQDAVADRMFELGMVSSGDDPGAVLGRQVRFHFGSYKTFLHSLGVDD